MGDTRGQKNCILEPYHLEGKKNHLLKLISNLGREQSWESGDTFLQK